MKTGIDLLTELTDYLNQTIITTNDQLQRNNTDLWDKFFHTYSDQDWDAMLTAMELLLQHYPEYFDAASKHKLTVKQTRTVWHKHNNNRILDHDQHKGTAWKMAMTIREVVNASTGVNLPNKPGQRNLLATQPKDTMFGQLFSYT
jgi:succinate dehydrogenase/fumarate reductase flavoprotein subunit